MKRLPFILLTVIGLHGACVSAQSAFNTTEFRINWDEAPQLYFSQLTSLNGSIRNALADDPQDFCFELKTTPLDIFRLPSTNCTIEGATSETGWRMDEGGTFSIRNGTGRIDFEARTLHTLELIAHPLPTTPAGRAPNSLRVVFNVIDFDERPVRKQNLDTRVLTHYLRANETVVTVPASSIWEDPEGLPVEFGDEVLLCESLEVNVVLGDDREESQCELIGRNTRVSREIVSVNHRGGSLMIKGDGPGISTAGVYYADLIVGYRYEDESDGDRNVYYQEMIRLFIKNGVNNAPSFANGATEFEIAVSETQAQDARDTRRRRIAPVTVGAWNASDLDSSDDIEYSLLGPRCRQGLSSVGGTGPYFHGVQVGEMCIMLFERGFDRDVELHGVGLNFEDPAIAPHGAFSITLRASDGWEHADVQIQVTLTDINELYLRKDSSGKTILPFRVRLIEGGTWGPTDLSQFYYDPEGDPLEFNLEISNENVAELDGTSLTLRGYGTDSDNTEANWNVHFQASDGQRTIDTDLLGSQFIGVDVRYQNSPPRLHPENVVGIRYTVLENSDAGTVIGLVNYRDDDSPGDEIEVEFESQVLLGHVDPLVIREDGEVMLCEVESETCRRAANSIALTTTAELDLDHESETHVRTKLRLHDGWSSSDWYFVTLDVIDVNDAPAAVAQVPNQTVNVGKTISFDSSSYFRDDDASDRLIIHAQSRDPTIATASVEGAADVSITGVKAGDVRVELTAVDRAGARASQLFDVTVNPNQAPVVQTDKFNAALPDKQTLQVGSTFEISLVGLFVDPDGDEITVEVESDSLAVLLPVTLSDGSAVVLTARSIGTANVTFTASDSVGNVTSEIRSIEVVSEQTENRAPVVNQDAVASALPSNNEIIDGQYFDLNLSNLFTDPDGDHLEFGAVSSDESVLRVDIVSDENLLRLIARSVGSVTLSILAEDTSGLSVELAETIRVIEDMSTGSNQPPIIDRDALASALPRNNTFAVPEYFEIQLDTVFSDPDLNDRVESYKIESSDETIMFTAVYDENLLTVFARSPGQATLTVVASDTQGAKTKLEESMTVTAPHANSLVVATQSLDRSAPLTIDLRDIWHGFERTEQPLEISATVDDQSIVSTTVAGPNIILNGHTIGRTFVKLKVDAETRTLARSMFFVEVVNAPPTVTSAIPDQNASRTDTQKIELGGLFADPDNDPLHLVAHAEDEKIVEVSLESNEIKLKGLAVGQTAVIVTATDPSGSSVTTRFVVTVDNIAPSAIRTFDDIQLQVGGDSVEVSAFEMFEDDGDPLSYSLEVAHEGVVDATMIGEIVGFKPISRGDTTVKLTATDVFGAKATVEATVYVGDERLQEAAQQALSGFGRAVLGSVSATVGERAQQKRHQSDLPDSVHPSNYLLGDVINTAEVQTRWSASSHLFDSSAQLDMVNAQTPLSSGRRDGRNHLDALIGKEHTFRIGSNDRQKTWSVWSQSDRQNFRSDPYDGSSKHLFLGVDTQIGDAVLIGVALSDHRGEIDYRHGDVAQRMDVRLNQLLPYGRVDLSEKAAIWATVGFGIGDVSTFATHALDEKSYLNNRMAIIGARQELVSVKRLQTALRGDFAIMALESSVGDRSIGNSVVKDLSRSRAGVESSYMLEVLNAVTIEPFAQINLRKDGGYSLHREGIELNGGLRFASNDLSIEVAVRRFNVNGMNAYAEQGVSVNASMNSRSDGTGFFASVAPRWGTDAYQRDLLWNDGFDLVYENLNRHEPYRNANTAVLGMRVDSELGYGFLCSRDRYLLTPFVRFTSDGYNREETFVGTQLRRISDVNRALYVRMSTGRVEVQDRVVDTSINFSLGLDM